ncbi:MAG: Do family serine endopeptidase [Candidatus Lernaella stagnicola]|nr:Do family serine endopeptidase [Candidatus Lernaella stagnicola]
MKITVAARAALAVSLFTIILLFAVPAQAEVPSFADLVKAAAPAVVNIDVSKDAPRRPGLFTPHKDRVQQGQGSGFIIDPEGYIVTNNHVVRDSAQIVVRLSDKRAFPAKIIGTDPKTDLALLKIEESGLPYLRFGDSEQLEVGEWVVAIGNPLGFSHTVTAGIVSAKGRWIGATQYDDFIQTDASINPGNSGGPLLNTSGEVVGINTLIAAGQGLGFAIPSNLARHIIGQLQEAGSVARAWLGVQHQQVTPELAASFGLDRPRGALVRQVVADSPAKKAGIESGDIIVEFDGRSVEDSRDLPIMVSNMPIGKRVSVVVVRNGREKSLKVTLGDLDRAITSLSPAEPQKPTHKKHEVLGMLLADITPPVARKLGVPPGRGVLIQRVNPLGSAAQKGLAQEDIIVKINGVKVKSVAKVVASISALPEGALVRFFVQRGDFTFFATLTR